MAYGLYMIIDGREVKVAQYLFKEKAEKIGRALTQQAVGSSKKIRYELRKEKWKN